ncbi:MAG TPA: MFS transporter [Verrucomicrobiae bacterium]|nr:MFS transporter [Verrucomicrobiae bacterium]
MRNPWLWVPTLYLAEGFPNALATTVALILYQDLGISNGRVTFYTGLFYLPWVIKPLWSPVVDILRTRRLWIWQTQLLLGLALTGIAMSLSATHFFVISMAFFWLLTFCSATHDIAADGFYMLGLAEKEQSFFVGVRGTFFRIALLCAQGPFIIYVGRLEARTGNVALSWALAFASMAAVFLCMGIYHAVVLPRPAADSPGDTESLRKFFTEFFSTFEAFFKKPKIGAMLLFLLFYRFGEAQLLKVTPLFVKHARVDGGLGLTTEQFGTIYSMVGVVALLAGGIAGGILVSRHGLRAWLWPMVIVMHLPDAVFIYLSYARPENLHLTAACVALEQFGYGFGFTAYMLYMIYIARGPHSTAHYAICTGFMALGLMVPGLWSGKLQEILGYPHFFIWAMLATIPGFIVTALIPLDAEFGKRSAGDSPAGR